MPYACGEESRPVRQLTESRPFGLEVSGKPPRSVVIACSLPASSFQNLCYPSNWRGRATHGLTSVRCRYLAGTANSRAPLPWASLRILLVHRRLQQSLLFPAKSFVKPWSWFQQLPARSFPQRASFPCHATLFRAPCSCLSVLMLQHGQIPLSQELMPPTSY